MPGSQCVTSVRCGPLGCTPVWVFSYDYMVGRCCERHLQRWHQSYTRCSWNGRSRTPPLPPTLVSWISFWQSLYVVLRHLLRYWSHAGLSSCHSCCFLKLSTPGVDFSCAKLAPTSFGKYHLWLLSLENVRQPSWFLSEIRYSVHFPWNSLPLHDFLWFAVVCT